MKLGHQLSQRMQSLHAVINNLTSFFFHLFADYHAINRTQLSSGSKTGQPELEAENQHNEMKRLLCVIKNGQRNKNNNKIQKPERLAASKLICPLKHNL
ncbi:MULTISPECIES: hypothetical protein [Enterobacter]|uniref:hypothetical protein n=1 Tax=Enterobacter TaxID=547 RepID=UPI0013E95486|nr:MULTISPECIES: hypothetical protein [Enterobacter]MCR1331188.1 hypothetical protein [Enterobacter sp. BT4]